MNQNNLPDLNIVKGVIAIAIGVILLFFCSSIIIRLALFVIGLALIHYGLRLLNIPMLNNLLETVKNYYRKLLS